MATKGIPSIPDVPSKLTESDIYRILDPIKRVMDIRQGKFSPDDKWVTMQDLIDAGITTSAVVASPVQLQVSPAAPAMELQDTGIKLSDGVELLNFIGFTVDEPTADKFNIRFGVNNNAEYSPGYNYTKQSDTTFTIDLVDAVNLFYVSRRIKFGSSGAYTYGAVSVIPVYNTTHANDTFVTVVMESGVIPTTIDELYLVSSDVNWSPIAGDPFSGGVIRDITTGIIGTTQWWFAVGDNGKVATSSDGGATWTLRTTVTTNHMYVCCYDNDLEKFWAAGATGDLISTTDGVTMVEDTTSIAALSASGGSEDIYGMDYNDAEGVLLVTYQVAPTTASHASTLDNGLNWTLRGNLSTNSGHDKMTKVRPVSATADTNEYWSKSNGTDMKQTLGHTATPNQAEASLTDTVTAIGFFWDANIPGEARIYGFDNGGIQGVANWQGDDSITFTQRITDFAWSPTHDRLVCVCNLGYLGYQDTANRATANKWTAVTNGFNPLANITAVEWNESDSVFVAVADNGQICRSTNGTN